MRRKHVTEDLSAYIDGAARHPKRIARHLQVCESCAKRHLELLKISAALHDLDGPAPRPGFSQQVLSSLANEEPAGRRWFWSISFPGPRFAWALPSVLLLFIAGLATWQALKTAPEPGRAAQSQLWTDDEMVILEIERLMAEGIDPSAFLLDASEGELVLEISLDDISEVLAMSIDESFEEMEVPSGFFQNDDLFAEIETLDPQTEEVLCELLYEYLAQAGNKG